MATEVNGAYPPRDELPIPHHPELEDDTMIRRILERPLESSSKARFNVLDVRKEVVEWHEDIDDNELAQWTCAAPTKGNDQESLRVFFIDTRASKGGWLPGHRSLRADTVGIFIAGGLSPLILSDIYSPDGRWAKMGNHCFRHHNKEGDITKFEVLYRYRCGLEQGVSFTHYIRTRTERKYFCINYPERGIARLKEYLARSPQLAYREYFLITLAVDEALRAWQNTISDRRAKLLDMEQRTVFKQLDVATIDLHALSTHWHIIFNDTSEFGKQIQFLQGTFRKYMNDLQDPRNNWIVEHNSNIQESLEALSSRCSSYTGWITNYRERTNVRINLLFHLANQRESRTNIDIAASTAKVAEQTRQDSASMITIAVVAMFFLPGTFISSILSTTFFEYHPNALSVSSKWWILPAATIPLTILVFSIWFAWHNERFRHILRSVKGIWNRE